MKITLLPIHELSDDLCQRWVSVQEANPALAGPCFRPELFLAVGAFHPGVFVAVASDDTGPVGFLPLLRSSRWPVAKRVPMCDYLAIIGPPDRRWDVRGLLRGAGLRAWDVASLVGAESYLGPAGCLTSNESPRVSLASGFDSYLAFLLQEGKSLRNVRNKGRLAERDLGPLRFVPLYGESKVLHIILDWKAQRFNRGRPLPGWVIGALERFLGAGGAVSGALSALYAGDALLAAHFGIRSQGVLHYWFPGFDPAFSRYTPGWLLVYHLLAHLSDMGCQVLDFGPGGETYKGYFCNQALPIASGYFEVPSLVELARAASRLFQRSRSAVRQTLRPFKRLL
jgi:CelD/BcsL family acetyltransferase involved in cellulose biosynthesis